MKKEKLYENIFSSLNDGVLVVSCDMEMIFMNPALEHIFNISASHYINKSLLDFSGGNTHLNNIIQKTLRTGETIFDFEYNFFDKSCKNFPVDITVLPLLEANDSITGVVIVVRDLRRVKELKERMRYQEGLANMETMASGMAHEIKNPLGGIRGAAQLLRMELEKKEFKEYLNVIIKEVDRINHIVENVLGFTKPKKTKFRSVNIHKIIKEILLLQKESPLMKKIKIKQEYDPSLPFVNADENKLKQVFLNLIQNSLEAMKNQGTLTLATKLDADFQILTKKHKVPTRMLVVEIKDTGKEVPDEIIDKLFTPFFTTKSKGTGLGLFISHKIIEEHGGRLKIVKNKDKGFIAKVYIPLKRT